MRISDWSSDVCSSDLVCRALMPPTSVSPEVGGMGARVGCTGAPNVGGWGQRQAALRWDPTSSTTPPIHVGSAVIWCPVKRKVDRQSVGEGNSVSVRVDHGGSRCIKKNTK